MTNKHDRLYKEVENAAKELFSDTSVSQEETAASLKMLIEEIEIWIDTLEQ